MKKMVKPVMTAIAVALVLCSIIGGTVAWLVAETETVTNTFTYGDIDIDLEETDTNKDADNNENTNTYPMIPGGDITKDPKVTVKQGSEACYLFTALTEKGGNVEVAGVKHSFGSYLAYEIAVGWTEVPNSQVIAQDGSVTKYYYREVAKTDVENNDVVYGVIKDNKVTVEQTVTKEMLNALDKDIDGNALTDPVYPKLEVTACAVQKDNLVFEEAWNIAFEKFGQ